MRGFLENRQLPDGRFILEKKGSRPPLGDNNLPLEKYRYLFKGPVKQCRLCVHHRPRNVKVNSGGIPSYRGAFSCAVKDFQSSSGYVVVVNCDNWRLAEGAPRKNRGQAWLHMGPVKKRQHSMPEAKELQVRWARPDPDARVLNGGMTRRKG